MFFIKVPSPSNSLVRFRTAERGLEQDLKKRETSRDYKRTAVDHDLDVLQGKREKKEFDGHGGSEASSPQHTQDCRKKGRERKKTKETAKTKAVKNDDKRLRKGKREEKDERDRKNKIGQKQQQKTEKQRKNKAKTIEAAILSRKYPKAQ